MGEDRLHIVFGTGQVGNARRPADLGDVRHVEQSGMHGN